MIIITEVTSYRSDETDLVVRDATINCLGVYPSQGNAVMDCLKLNKMPLLLVQALANTEIKEERGFQNIYIEIENPTPKDTTQEEDTRYFYMFIEQ